MPGSGEEQGGSAAESCASQLERCRVDLSARRDALVQFDLEAEELKADRSAALSALEQCRKLTAEVEECLKQGAGGEGCLKKAAEARAEADRSKCYLEGRRFNPATLRCEGAVPYKLHLTTPRSESPPP